MPTQPPPADATAADRLAFLAADMEESAAVLRLLTVCAQVDVEFRDCIRAELSPAAWDNPSPGYYLAERGPVWEGRPGDHPLLRPLREAVEAVMAATRVRQQQHLELATGEWMAAAATTIWRRVVRLLQESGAELCDAQAVAWALVCAHTEHGQTYS